MQQLKLRHLILVLFMVVSLTACKKNLDIDRTLRLNATWDSLEFSATQIVPKVYLEKGKLSLCTIEGYDDAGNYIRLAWTFAPDQETEYQMGDSINASVGLANGESFSTWPNYDGFVRFRTVVSAKKGPISGEFEFKATHPWGQPGRFHATNGDFYIDAFD